MPILRLTSNLEAGAVTIRAEGVADNLTLTREDANGWRAVRTFAGLGASDGTLVVTDSEPALHGEILYRLGDASATIRLDGALYPYRGVTGDRLTVATDPSIAHAPLLTLSLEATRESSSTSHAVVGRADLITVRGPLRLRSGTFRLLAPDVAAVAEIERVYESGRVALLRFAGSSARDLYHTASSVSVAPELVDAAGAQYWAVAVSFAEKRYPTGSLEGSAGWTFDVLTGYAPAFDVLRTAFDSFDSLTVGPAA